VRPTERSSTLVGSTRSPLDDPSITGRVAGVLVYFCTAIVAVIAYLFVYTPSAATDEFSSSATTIRRPRLRLASACSASCCVVSAIAHSANVVDCLIWSVIALIVQIVVYYDRQDTGAEPVGENRGGELAAAIWLGLASLAAGRSCRLDDY